MRGLVLAVLAVLAAVAGTAPARSTDTAPAHCPPNPICRWNEAALQAVRAGRTPPPVAARNLATVHLAVHDAAAATVATDAPFRVRYVAVVDADPAAAAAVAAHRVLVELYPTRVADFDAALDDTLDPIPDGPAKARGVALGKATAEAVLRWRAGDGGVARRSDYRPQKQGVEQPAADPGEVRPPLLPGRTAYRASPSPIRPRSARRRRPSGHRYQRVPTPKSP